MASPKSGNACTLISPTAPKAAEEADVADPGEVEKVKAKQRQDKAGKYGKVDPKVHKPEEEKQKDKEQKKTWIEIVLKDEEDKPVAGEPYVVKLPDGSEYTGSLDDEGKARVEGNDPGEATVEFPKIDEKAWNDAQ